jgi:hypothetical protein
MLSAEPHSCVINHRFLLRDTAPPKEAKEMVLKFRDEVIAKRKAQPAVRKLCADAGFHLVCLSHIGVAQPG